jgi:hypothetical protein
VLSRVEELAARTVIFDVEPLVAYWDSGEDELERRVALLVLRASQLPEEQPGAPVASEEPEVLQFGWRCSAPDLVLPAPRLHQPPGPGERVGHRWLDQQVLGLDVDDDRTVISGQEVIRHVLTDLPAYLRLQQEGLGQDAMY